MKEQSKERLFEVMSRLDKTFLIKEDIEEKEEEFTVEPQEHGKEGAKYKAKLEEITKHAEKIYKGLPEGEIPSWVQDKITLA